MSEWKLFDFKVYVGWEPDNWQTNRSPTNIPPSDFGDYLEAFQILVQKQGQNP